jgi:hypothetical protein
VETVNLLATLLQPDATSVQRFLTDWYGEHRPEYGLPPDEIESFVPPPLRDFYAFAGRWEGIFVQNRFARPHELERVDGHVAFYVENQGVFAWAAEAHGEDPPVWGTWDVPSGIVGWEFEREQWIREEEPLSRFLLQVVLFEAVIGAREQAAASWLGPDEQKRLRERFVDLPLGAWHWPDYPTRFYARDDALAVVCPNRSPDSDDFASVWVGATDAQSLRFLEDLVDDAWEHYSPAERNGA